MREALALGRGDQPAVKETGHASDTRSQAGDASGDGGFVIS
jgi:hypothetical protein